MLTKRNKSTKLTPSFIDTGIRLDSIGQYWQVLDGFGCYRMVLGGMYRVVLERMAQNAMGWYEVVVCFFGKELDLQYNFKKPDLTE